MKQIITLIGPIGSFVLNGEQTNGIQLKDVVAKFTQLPEGTKDVQIDIAGPGGVKSVGDSIYNFIKGENVKYNITMNQVGDIGSIMSRVWFGAPKRVALKGINPETNKPYEIFIHNPWTEVRGDSKEIRRTLDGIEPEEAELRAFYMAETGISEEGIAPLLDSETGITAEEAVAMKFATSLREATTVIAYMSKTNTTMQDRLDKVLAAIEGAFAKGKAVEVKALVMELEGDKKIFIGTEDATKLEGMDAKTVDATGTAAGTENYPDGPAKLKDGRTLTIAAGKVTKVDAPTAAPTTVPGATQATPAEQALNAFVEKLEALFTPKQEAATVALKADDVKVIVATAVEDLKKSIKTTQKPAGYYNVVTEGEEKISPVQAMRRMHEAKRNSGK